MGIITNIYKIFIAHEICRGTSIVRCIAISIMTMLQCNCSEYFKICYYIED